MIAHISPASKVMLQILQVRLQHYVNWECPDVQAGFRKAEEPEIKLGKEYIKAVYCHPAYLIYMQSTSWETLDWMKHNWSQDCWENQQRQIWRWHHPYGRKQRGTEEPLDEVEQGELKIWVKTTFKKQRLWHPLPSLQDK